MVFQNGEEIYEFESTESYKTEEPISFPLALHISGDIKLQFYSVSDILGVSNNGLTETVVFFVIVDVFTARSHHHPSIK